MAKRKGFFTDGGDPGKEDEESPSIPCWYTKGVSSTRLDDMSGTEGWPLPNENPALADRQNRRAFAARQGMIAGYLRQFRGNALAREFLSNMGEDKAGYPRIGRDGKLCGVRLIVVHYTGTKTKKPALYTFESGIVTDGETGERNIGTGAHFLIDENGKAIQLAPLGAIVMHAKGFNLPSIGIEIAAEGESHITPAQVAAAASLCEKLMSEHPEISYVAGHCELTDRKKPYHDLFHVRPSGSSKHNPEGKPDPGVGVMGRIRAVIRTDMRDGKLPGCRLVDSAGAAGMRAPNRQVAPAIF